ncbi:hypothetical protein BST81_20745 [Leptolyngbya sp. 'hensonii']|uniref:MAPEG family protein n=1 Tax=Leptolyngbya sp. 'hensonii' TaxID=1922337 RepID=UPI00094F7ED7|nr:MAPEG family protein [Leptolyngbya sp. 'hensonii']OLP16416.1 hypothetical protein BST81_20745 [Leptolyngbya sp. 'hensonii']
MTTDLTCLLILTLWTLLLNHIPAVARITKGGVAWGLSNREVMPEVAPWVGRADRAQRNHQDNLALIAIVILIAQITGQADGITAISSIIMVVSRILHGLTYIAGNPLLRSTAYFVSILALLTIVWRILT